MLWSRSRVFEAPYFSRSLPQVFLQLLVLLDRILESLTSGLLISLVGEGLRLLLHSVFRLSHFLSHVDDDLSVVFQQVQEFSLSEGLLSFLALLYDVRVVFHHRIELEPNRCQSRRYQLVGVGVMVFGVCHFQ